MPKKENRSQQGRKLTAKDVAERLLPDLDMNELLLWSPDLFSYTSYLMSLTGAYQLVVSPPSGKKWQPTNGEIKEWLGICLGQNDEFDGTVLEGNVEKWLSSFVRDSVKTKEEYEALIRKEPEKAEKWGFDPSAWTKYSNTGYFDKTFVASIKRATESKDAEKIISEHIGKYALESLSEIKLNIIDIKCFGNIEEYETKGHTISKIKEPNKIYHFKEEEKEVDGKVIKVKEIHLGELLKYDDESNWVQFVQGVGDAWRERLRKIKDEEFDLIDDGETNSEKKLRYTDNKKKYNGNYAHKLREEELLGILLKYTPPLLIACWAFFYNRVNEKVNETEMSVSDLLCNRDDLQTNAESDCNELWKISQSLLTMHAIADICCTKWGIGTIEKREDNKARWFAETLLFDKGSLSTINPERGRVMPKRHNPGVGITLRSISSNLGFHRSSVDVVWRKTENTKLEEQIEEQIKKDDRPTFTLLLLPFPLDVKAKDFKRDEIAEKKVNFDTNQFGFFGYEPKATIDDNDRIIKLIKRAGDELENNIVDAIIFPEDALSKTEYDNLQEALEQEAVKENTTFKAPSLFIAGVRESRFDAFNKIEREKQENLLPDEKEKIEKEISELRAKLSGETDEDKKTELQKKLDDLEGGKNKDEFLINRIVNFCRNAVYCKYYDSGEGQKSYTHKKTNGENTLYQPIHTPKYEQYKHHRWRLDSSQITRYGLSSILSEKKIWWEAIKIPKRRVSFLNVGNRITISHLVCEDLARQDPIADLIRHVGPSLVVTLLMDGPQVKNRWSGRYASVLSDDPGSSVITLTSWGMVKRHSSPYDLMSKVIGLWSESGGDELREIELADGAEAVLLNLRLDKVFEKTGDGREEREPTSVLRLLDVIQIYPEKKS